MREDSTVFVGLDLGDRYSEMYVVDGAGEMMETGRLATSAPAIERRFGNSPACRIGLEAGTHSSWVSQLLKSLGHEVVVADARRLRLIYQNERKNDRADAEYLARLVRLDPELLSPVHHRSPQSQADLALLRARDGLVRARTQLINQARGLVKSFGGRLPACSAESFHCRAAEAVPPPLQPALAPLFAAAGELTRQIRSYDREVGKLAKERYPETMILRQPAGVGALTALAFVLTLEDPRRFRKSREVGPTLGLVPRQKQSSGHDPQLRITKTGDAYLRRLLVGSAQYLLGPFGPDSDLRRWGLALAARGGKNAKKRAIVAVARKLAVLLHHLWLTGEVYQPSQLPLPQAA